MNKDTQENRPYNTKYLLRKGYPKMFLTVGRWSIKKTIPIGPLVFGMVGLMKIAQGWIAIRHILVLTVGKML
ncbi:hypothetical protein AUA11_20735 [Salmonella enterica subsp. arizonae serovar 18:z4,z23:-]|nr:hypothetical protein [Salmonella enterica subsp. arizonae serovar 18:z4,z23:-]